MVVDWLRMLKIVTRLAKYPLAGITSGEAEGADRMAHDAADLLGVPFHPFPVKSGPGSFAVRAFRRNQQIVDRSDRLVALFAPGPLSRGTADSVERALKKGIPVDSLWQNRWYSGLPPVSLRPSSRTQSSAPSSSPQHVSGSPSRP